jgi:hypothetical protein
MSRRKQAGREVVQVTLDRPDGIESSEGLSEFVALLTQLSPVGANRVAGHVCPSRSYTEL